MSTNIKDLPTPCFLLDMERMKRNTSNMLNICNDLNVSLRCHTKTHKTIELAEMATGGTKRNITVSTIAEADAYAKAGFDDILYAFPITQDKIDRCVDLMSRLKEFHVMVSDLSGVECLKSNMDKLPKGKTWSVAVEIDPGYGRTGFLSCSDEFVQAFREVLNKMKLLSLYTHCGGSYDIATKKERDHYHNEVVKTMTACKARILEEFPNAEFVIGIGSTPSCSIPIESDRQLGEFHPGNYVFYDYEQYLLNTCRESDIACCVMTRVIAHKEEKSMILVDCGFLALGHDGIKQRPHDFCLIAGESNLKLIGMTQEIGKIKAKEGELDCKKYPVGTILHIYPFHSCLTAALHQVHHVHSGDKLVATWKPIKGW